MSSVAGKPTPSSVTVKNYLTVFLPNACQRFIWPARPSGKGVFERVGNELINDQAAWDSLLQTQIDRIDIALELNSGSRWAKSMD